LPQGSTAQQSARGAALLRGVHEASQFFGDFTHASINSYWIGAGFTWRFDHGLSTLN
jgi:hypothetical protein